MLRIFRALLIQAANAIKEFLAFATKKTRTSGTLNFQKVGRPSIYNNIVSGFDTSNYLSFPYFRERILNSNYWEFVWKFKYNGNYTDQGIFGTTFSYSSGLRITGGKLSLRLKMSTSYSGQYYVVAGTTALESGHIYSARVTFDGSVYKLYLKESGDWNLEASFANAGKQVQESVWNLGWVDASPSLNYNDIYLDGSYFIFDDEVIRFTYSPLIAGDQILLNDGTGESAYDWNAYPVNPDVTDPMVGDFSANGIIDNIKEINGDTVFTTDGPFINYYAFTDENDNSIYTTSTAQKLNFTNLQNIGCSINGTKISGGTGKYLQSKNAIDFTHATSWELQTVYQYSGGGDEPMIFASGPVDYCGLIFLVISGNLRLYAKTTSANSWNYFSGESMNITMELGEIYHFKLGYTNTNGYYLDYYKESDAEHTYTRIWENTTKRDPIYSNQSVQFLHWTWRSYDYYYSIGPIDLGKTHLILNGTEVELCRLEVDSPLFDSSLKTINSEGHTYANDIITLNNISYEYNAAKNKRSKFVENDAIINTGTLYHAYTNKIDSTDTVYTNADSLLQPYPGEELLPKLTANGTMGGDTYACAASHESGGGYAYLAFNGDYSTGEQCWWTYHGRTSTVNPCWITYYSPIAVVPTRVIIKNEVATPASPKMGTVQGSNDNSTWDDLTHFAVLNNDTGRVTEVKVNTHNSYKYIRFYFINGWDSAGISIQEIDIYKATGSLGKLYDYDATDQTFIEKDPQPAYLAKEPGPTNSMINAFCTDLGNGRYEGGSYKYLAMFDVLDTYNADTWSIKLRYTHNTNPNNWNAIIAQTTRDDSGLTLNVRSNGDVQVNLRRQSGGWIIADISVNLTAVQGTTYDMILGYDSSLTNKYYFKYKRVGIDDDYYQSWSSDPSVTERNYQFDPLSFLGSAQYDFTYYRYNTGILDLSQLEITLDGVTTTYYDPESGVLIGNALYEPTVNQDKVDPIDTTINAIDNTNIHTVNLTTTDSVQNVAYYNYTNNTDSTDVIYTKDNPIKDSKAFKPAHSLTATGALTERNGVYSGFYNSGARLVYTEGNTYTALGAIKYLQYIFKVSTASRFNGSDRIFQGVTSGSDVFVIGMVEGEIWWRIANTNKLSISDPAITTNREYIIKLTYEDGVYSGCFSMDDGETWSTPVTNATTEPYINFTQFYIGTRGSGGNHYVTDWEGTIDLNHSSIQINDQVLTFNAISENERPSVIYEYDSQADKFIVKDPQPAFEYDAQGLQNASVYGTLTENNGVYSGFGALNYISPDTQFYDITSVADSWEVVFHFQFKRDILPSSGNNYDAQALYGRTGGWNSMLAIDNNTKVLWLSLYNGTAERYVICNIKGTTELVEDNWYYAKYMFTGTEYKMYLSTTGEFAGEETLEGTPVETTTKYTYTGYPMEIGACVNATEYIRPFQGSIDIKGSYIKMNDTVTLLYNDSSKVYIGDDCYIYNAEATVEKSEVFPAIITDTRAPVTSAIYLNKGYRWFFLDTFSDPNYSIARIEVGNELFQESDLPRWVRTDAPVVYGITYNNKSIDSAYADSNVQDIIKYRNTFNVTGLYPGATVTYTINGVDIEKQDMTPIEVYSGWNIKYTITINGGILEQGSYKVPTTIKRTAFTQATQQLLEFTITPTPVDAEVVLGAYTTDTNGTYVLLPQYPQIGNSIYVPDGTYVKWEVSQYGYITQSGIQLMEIEDE